jgi:hypothetical protein
VESLENILERKLNPQKPGPKKQAKNQIYCPRNHPRYTVPGTTPEPPRPRNHPRHNRPFGDGPPQCVLRPVLAALCGRKVQPNMKNWFYPSIKKSDLLAILPFAFIGSLFGGLYGIVHDQLTYSISREYFTKLKFDQFSYLNFGFPERVLVGEIGFLATAGVGFIMGWFLARWFLPRLPYESARRAIYKAFIFIVLSGMIIALIAWLYGIAAEPSLNLNGWSYNLKYLGISDGWAFVRVAYIHYGGYLGGLIGLIISIIVLECERGRT